jgi:hypothetical protein
METLTMILIYLLWPVYIYITYRTVLFFVKRFESGLPDRERTM